MNINSLAKRVLRLVLGVHMVPDERTSWLVYFYQSFVHHCGLYCWRFYLASITSAITYCVVLVEVYDHKVLSQCLEDLHIPPLLRVDRPKMHLNDDLVDPF